MIDNAFRSRFELFLGPILKWLKLKGVTPNQITVLSLAVAFLGAYLISQGQLISGFLVYWLSRILDGVDGIFARLTNQQSLFGSYIDICCDMLAYSSVIFAFSFPFPDNQRLYLAILIMYTMSICSALSLGSLERDVKLEKRDNRGLRLGAGLAEGGETFITYLLCCNFPSYISEILSVWLGVLILSVSLRSMLAYKVLRQS